MFGLFGVNRISSNYMHGFVSVECCYFKNDGTLFRAAVGTRKWFKFSFPSLGESGLQLSLRLSLMGLLFVFRADFDGGTDHKAGDK